MKAALIVAVALFALGAHAAVYHCRNDRSGNDDLLRLAGSAPRIHFRYEGEPVTCDRLDLPSTVPGESPALSQPNRPGQCWVSNRNVFCNPPLGG